MTGAEAQVEALIVGVIDTTLAVSSDATKDRATYVVVEGAGSWPSSRGVVREQFEAEQVIASGEDGIIFSSGEESQFERGDENMDEPDAGVE